MIDSICRLGLSLSLAGGKLVVSSSVSEQMRDKLAEMLADDASITSEPMEIPLFSCCG